MPSEMIKFNNKVTITLKDKSNNVIEQQVYKNLVTTVGNQLLLDILGCDGRTGISYCVVGTDDTAAVIGDTTLGSESARNQSVYYRSQSTGTYSVFFNTSQGNTTLKEVGFFGDDASDTVDSGTLFNRIILDTPITKTTDYTLTVDLDITFTQ